MRFLVSLCLLLMTLLWGSGCQPKNKSEWVPQKYEDLPRLFVEWRAFEEPPMLDGAPDYTESSFLKRIPEFKRLQLQLLAMDTMGWTVTQQADWMILWAEMNGYDFNQRVLKPWARDPAFYQSVFTERSDVPAHEGPAHHRLTELWMYTYPLSESGKKRMLADLSIIPPLQLQARKNLTGNAKDIWITGIRNIRNQSRDLKNLLDSPGIRQEGSLVSAIEKAISSTNAFADWLEAEAPRKTGPSGLGKEQYTWYQQNVHLVPLIWEQEVMLMKRELVRAWSALKLEEHRNRNLPPLVAANSPEAYEQLANASADNLLQFLKEQDIVTVKDYFEPALKKHLGGFVPADKRNFFWITAHYDPRPLYSHFYHWFELARMDLEPHPNPIRRSPLLYNIFDSRNEGMATAVEEIFLQAGLYDNNPRVREIVYIMLAQRAARGLGSLYAHANEMTMGEAGGIHAEFTPRGWMKTEKDLQIFEQHLYLRQPGYGTSYITGKYLIEGAMANMARQKEMKGETFVLKDFFDGMNRIGCIPAALAGWELSGEKGVLP